MTLNAEWLNKLSVWLVALALAFSVINFFQLSTINSLIGDSGVRTGPSTGLSVLPGTQNAPVQVAPQNAGTAGTVTVAAFAELPKGIPAIYGAELGVSFDDVSAKNPQKADETIKKLGILDQQITLTGADLERYKTIALQISCEYCCGAPSIIFENGDPACGCAHSYAMRGLAKYLITKHASEYSDDQILEEMSKWKTLFFPDVMAQKAGVMAQKGIEFNYINLASNKYRGLENEAQGSGGAMVGGC